MLRFDLLTKYKKLPGESADGDTSEMRVYVQAAGINVTAKSMSRLRGRRWLNGDIINSYVSLVNVRANSPQDLHAHSALQGVDGIHLLFGKLHLSEGADGDGAAVDVSSDVQEARDS